MSFALTPRRGRRIAAASALAAAALALTACQSSAADKESDALRPAPATAAQKTAATATTAHFSGTATTPDTATGHTATGHTAARTPACTPEMLRFHAGEVRRPINHMLLSVTNFSDKICTFAAQPYPLLRLVDDQQAVTPVIKDSKPQTVITLAPHESAYAGITTSAGDGSGGHGERIDHVGVALATDTPLTPVELSNGRPVYVEPNAARVTYWQANSADALMW